jgi:predicted membrane-bound dolichyl-phosphate-mannose-protein mannosyltransferase
MKIDIGKKNFFIPSILMVLFFGFLIRIILLPFGTLKLDFNTFVSWGSLLAKNGFANFYSGWSDYLPGYLYILWFLGKVGSFLPQLLVYKLPAIFSDLITGYLIYLIVKKIKNEKLGIILSSFYIFNPAIFANSTLWGQVDSLTALFSLLSIYLVNINPIFSAISLSLGTLIKPQAAFILPVIIFLMFKNKWKLEKIILYLLTGLVIFVLGFVPFAGGKSLIPFIIERLGISSSQYPFTSINAFNFWGLFGFWKTDLGKIPLYVFGIISTLSVSLIGFLKLRKIKNSEYVLAALIFLSSFIFMTRIHERHLLAVFAPLLISSVILPNLLITVIALSFIYLANLLYSYVWITNNFQTIFSPFVIKMFIVVNVACLGFLIFEILRKKKINYIEILKQFWLKLKNGGQELKNKIVFPPIKIAPRKLKIILWIILIFALVTRLAFLWQPKNEYFDEVYHAFTARQMLHGNKAAWEWWNTPPAGFAYEWTHPPVAKLAMWLSMAILGESAFAWRLPGALLGVGSVFLVYLIAKKLFKDELVGILAAGFFSLDGLVLTMSRIGMNDSYMLFFVLLTIYFFLKEKNFFSAVAFGLALASKWSALYAAPILFVIWLLRKKKFTWSLLWFAVLPFLVYLATYIPMFLSGHSLEIFWGMQKQMWWYHTGLVATHPYSSQAWSWPFMIRPVYLYTSDEIGGWVARIYNIGNPIVFWFGLVSVTISLIYSFLERNKTLGLVVFSYLIFFLPWIASPRIMFFYHYLPSMPFLAIATGYVLRREKSFIIPIFSFAFLMFLYFYPHWAGIKIPLWWDSSYYWFASWR